MKPSIGFIAVLKGIYSRNSIIVLLRVNSYQESLQVHKGCFTLLYELARLKQERAI